MKPGFGHALKRLLRTDRAFKILGPKGGSYTAGGCWILAEALERWGKGKLRKVIILSSKDSYKNAQHVLIQRYPYDEFIDADGVHTKRYTEKFWEKTELVPAPIIVVFSSDRVRRIGIPCPKLKIDATYNLILTKFGPFEKWI